DDAKSQPRCILSTFWDPAHPDAHNGYAYEEGTSMAAPHVTGALALILSQQLSTSRRLDPTAAVNRLLDTVDTHVPCDSGSDNCKGRVDVARAVSVPAGQPGTTANTAPPPTQPRANTPPSTVATIHASGAPGAPANGGVLAPPPPAVAADA